MPKKNTADYIVSADCGNSTGVAIGLKADSRCVLTMQPFTVARRQYSPRQLDGMKDTFKTLPYYTHKGTQYTVGLDTAQYHYGNPTQRDTNNTARYGSTLHRFFTWVAIHRLRITSGKIALTVFMPPLEYMNPERREGVRLAFLQDSPVSMTYTDETGETEAIEIDITDVTVLPEGACSVYGMILDKAGRQNNKGVALIKEGYIAVIDLGSYTADSVLLRNGQVDETSLDGSTIPGLGVHSLIRQPLIDKYGVPNETVDNAVIQFVQNGYKGPVMVQNGEGRSFDITSDIERLRQGYFEAIVSDIIHTRFNDLKDKKGAILVGGGSMVIYDLLTQAYRSNIDMGSNIAEPHLINAESGFRKALFEAGIHPDC